MGKIVKSVPDALVSLTQINVHIMRIVTFECKLCGATEKTRRWGPDLDREGCPAADDGKHVWAEQTDDLV